MSGDHDPSQQPQQQQQQASASCASSPTSGPLASHGSVTGVQAGNPAPSPTDTTAAAAAGSVVVVTDSVVPSLMQVYESMTQSRLDGLDGITNTNQQQQQHQHFLQQQQHHHQQLYHVPLANSVYYNSNLLLQQQQQQQMQLGPLMAGNNAPFQLPPVPDPTFLSAINGSNSMGAGHSANPAPPTMPDEQFSKKVATATEADGVATHGMAGDEAISSNDSYASVGGGGNGGRKTRKRVLPAAAKDDEGGTSSTSSTTGRGSKSRRKGKDTDGRWAKRFSWPEELHRDFVAAIFDVGLKHSSPTTILEHMPKHEQITNERVKSHLQKYRINRTKSKQEFMSSYEASLERLKKKKHHQDPGAIKVLSGAEVAGHLTYASTTNKSTADQADTSADSADSATTGVAAQHLQQQHQASQHGPIQAVTSADVAVPQEDVFIFPRLTQAEKQSPIGASVGYLMGLFFSLKHQLMVQREAQHQQHYQLQQSAQLSSSLAGAADDPSQVSAVFHSFVGLPPASAGPGVAATATTLAPSPTTAAAVQTPTVIHIPSLNGPGAASTTIPPAPPAVPSTRTNLEENNIMKREMQNQMAVQNKMRALKQQELSKYRSAGAVASTTMNTNSAPGSSTVTGGGPGSVDDAYQEEYNNNIPAPAQHTALRTMNFNKGQLVRSTSDELSSMRMAPPPASTAPMTASLAAHQQQQQQQLNPEQQQQQQYQVAGENAGDDPGGGAGGESASGNPLQLDDFWQHDVVDDQLFHFLMSDG